MYCNCWAKIPKIEKTIWKQFRTIVSKDKERGGGGKGEKEKVKVKEKEERWRKGVGKEQNDTKGLVLYRFKGSLEEGCNSQKGVN